MWKSLPTGGWRRREGGHGKRGKKGICLVFVSLSVLASANLMRAGANAIADRERRRPSARKEGWGMLVKVAWVVI